ncbi:MAG: hypothetical protein ACTHOR_19065, partial [Devosia sp.]
MADYKELIRKAIQALPENNGAARRAVYEKARAALVGQLRGLDPPLAARDITQHRLQLEDCIRQVEQEASEAVIAGLKQNEEFSGNAAAALPGPAPRAPSSRPTASAARPALPNGASARNGAAGTPRPAAAPAARPAAAAASARPAAAATAAANGASARPARATPTSVPRLTAVPGNAKPAAAAAPPRAAAATAAAPAPRAAGPAARTVARAPAVFPRAVPQPQPEPEPEEEETETIEDIIAAAEADLAEVPEIEAEEAPPDPVEEEPDPEPPMFRIEQRPPRKPASANGRAVAESRPVPAIVARAEAAKSARANGRVAPEPTATRRANGASAAAAPTARKPAEPIQLPRATPSNTAASSIREVELEDDPSEGEAQVAIERAIATLEREARNDGEPEVDEAPPAGRSTPGRRRGSADPGVAAEAEEPAFARAAPEQERGGGSALTIFLVVFLVLLLAAGGGTFWAWHEGYIDFDAMFGRTAATAQPATKPDATPVAPAPAAAQTNTEPAPSAPAKANEALTTAPGAAAAPAPAAPAAEPSAQTAGAPKSEERLSQGADNAAAPAPGTAGQASADAAAAGGSQSLLLEASQDGTTGAVPFSGTVEWSKGTDEMGQPTLIGKATIPARNLGVSVLIRKNSDPTLPASHLMEINFSVTDSFIGGAISGLPGVLLKNEELVQGTPLVGASARVVGNSFLFALSSSSQDEATNKDLLTSRKWMDLAIIYATGKKAIITLEKDDKAQQLFNDVFATWG